MYCLDHKKGFSLIEMLVYIAVLVLLSTAVVVTYLSLDRTLARNQTEREVTKAASTAMEHMLRSVRAASEIDTAERALPNELAVAQGMGTTTEFYLLGGRIYADVNDVTVGPLTTDAVSVSDLTFHQYALSGTALESELIRISFTVSANSKGASTTRTFSSAALLRGSYE